eukprot:s47_g4.t1
MAAAQPSRLGNLRLNLANSRLNLQKLLDLLEGLPCERIDELNASHNDLGDHALPVLSLSSFPRPMKRRKKVQLVALCGILISAYAFYVENKMDDPFYQPSCSSSWTGGNCVTVFKSPYGHILSHWGFVEKGSVFDLSLAVTGLLLYSCYFLAISVKVPFPLREEAFLAVATAGGFFSIYLLYVIKVILQDLWV